MFSPRRLHRSPRSPQAACMGRRRTPLCLAIPPGAVPAGRPGQRGPGLWVSGHPCAQPRICSGLASPSPERVSVGTTFPWKMAIERGLSWVGGHSARAQGVEQALFVLVAAAPLSPLCPVRTTEAGPVDAPCGCLGPLSGSLRASHPSGPLGMEAAKVLSMDEGENLQGKLYKRKQHAQFSRIPQADGESFI